MKIYTVNLNMTDFRRLEFVKHYDANAKLPLLEGECPEDWNPPKCRFIEQDKPLADFSMLDNGVIAYDFDNIDEGVDYSEWIGGLAEMAGGLAFIDVEQGPRQSVLFVTEACNALDRKRSVLRESGNDGEMQIEKFVFRANRIFSNSGLFRLADPALDTQYIFAYDDGALAGDSQNFYQRYVQRNMTGLKFDLVWEDEA